VREPVSFTCEYRGYLATHIAESYEEGFHSLVSFGAVFGNFPDCFEKALDLFFSVI
jgi:hypothetical protein